MSYRTFKHLLGETSLERKCRFIFGGGILVLVTTSFYWYGQKTEKLVIGQTTQTARRLVNPTVVDKHYKSDEFVNRETARMFDQLSQQLQGPGRPAELRGLHPQPLQADDEATPSPATTSRRTPWRGSSSRPSKGSARPASKKPYTFADGTSMEESRILPGKTEFQYIQAVLFKQECIDCHEAHATASCANGKYVEIKPGDLACAAVVHLPMEQINRDINQNRAILISAALVTAILAMVAS